jgi:hypothetical protein
LVKGFATLAEADAAFDVNYFHFQIAAGEALLALSGVLEIGGRIRGLGAARGAAGRGGDVVYHYTTEAAAKGIQRTGLWSQSSATNVGTYTAQEAMELLGVKTAPEVVIEFQNAGRFIPNRPAIVQPHPLGRGGGGDLINPAKVPPTCINCIRPVTP